MAAARSPALAASALLHGGLLVAALLSFQHLQREPPPPPPPPLGESVPVTVTAAAPAPAPRPEPSPAPEPSPPAPRQAPTPPPPPPPTPRPASPPEPTPAPVAKAKPVAHSKPAPELDLSALAKRLPSERRAERDLDLSALAASLPRGAAAKPQPSLNLDALAASLPAGRRAAAAAQAGPPRAAAAPGATLSPSTAGVLMAKIRPRWNGLDCDIAGADSIVVRVRFSVDAAGRLVGDPEVASVTGDAPESVKQAAARGAERAVRVSAPFDDVPPDQRKLMNPVTVKFSAAQSCKGRG